MDTINIIIAVVTVCCSGFGAFLGVKTGMVRIEKDLESLEKRHDERLASDSRRLDRLEAVLEKILELQMERPCKAHAERMVGMGEAIKELKDRLDKIDLRLDRRDHV